MSFFQNFTRARASERLLEEALYQQVGNEIREGQIRDGLWMKALAESNGDSSKTQALYLKYRIQSIKDEFELSRQVEARKVVVNPQPANQVKPSKKIMPEKPAQFETPFYTANAPKDIGSLIELLSDQAANESICQYANELIASGYDADGLIDLVSERGGVELARELSNALDFCGR